MLGARDHAGDGVAEAVAQTDYRLSNRVLGNGILGGVPLAGIAGLLTLLLVWGEYESKVFRVIVPYGVGSPAYDGWLNLIYRNWWASWESLPGFVAYCIIAYFAIYVIIIQNIAGLRAVILIGSLPSVATFHVDWQNRDGHFGWRPLADAYRTVVVSLAVHVFALGLIVFVMGLSGVVWIVGLLLLWLAAATAYIGVPFLTFRGVYKESATERVRVYFQSVPPLPNEALARIEREDSDRSWANQVHSCEFHPLFLRRRTPSWLLLYLVVPALLAVVQTVFPLLGK